MGTVAGTLGSDEIVIGRDFELTVTLDPPADKTEAEVTTELTGATVTAQLVDSTGTAVVSATGTLVSAPNRTIRVSLTAAQTTGLTAGIYRWNVRVTTSGAKVWPVRMPGYPQVHQIPA